MACHLVLTSDALSCLLGTELDAYLDAVIVLSTRVSLQKYTMEELSWHLRSNYADDRALSSAAEVL